MSPGYIYVLGNDSYQNNLLKIGRTSRSPNERMEELAQPTGVPGTFYLLYAEYIFDVNTAEWLIHKSLSDSKHSKEFFSLPLEDAIRNIQLVCQGLRTNSNLEYAKDLPILLSNMNSIASKNIKNNLKNEVTEERMLSRQLMPQYMKDYERKLLVKQTPIINSSNKKSYIREWLHYFEFDNHSDSYELEFMSFSFKAINQAFTWVNSNFCELDLGGNFAWFVCAREIAELVHNENWNKKAEILLLSRRLKNTRWYAK